MQKIVYNIYVILHKVIVNLKRAPLKGAFFELFVTKSTPGSARGKGELIARKKVDKKKTP